MIEETMQNASDDRVQHNIAQAAEFDSLAEIFETTPTDEVLDSRLDAIVAAGRVPAGARVLDVGSGAGVLANRITKIVPDVELWACDLSTAMAEAARRKVSYAEYLMVDIIDFPLDRGPFDAIFCNGMFGNVWDQEAALGRCAELLSAAGRVVISHPLGRQFVEGLHAAQPEITRHTLPDDRGLATLAERTGLAVESVRDETDLYIAVLRRAN
ncbi:class I SAM-dependent methyltransferase [Nocardia transvalensis]|uniref:class I SAM-dependent methyltransferase n=1 Tax=Nocardia transvalensis TaxID=37333 RepID=UPI00189416F7|nr:class I SAM-dependent methyltransferase [Nocardia transvalensis]MBF6331480.1 methyltransferase domain-containing protein [Nocardia transvalensis]